MFPPRSILAASLALSLPIPGWAQPSSVEEEAVKPGEEIVLPEITYPKPETEEQKKAAEKHEKGAQGLAVEQDELSADVQELIEEQTDEKVIQLLEAVEEIMAEVTSSLDETNTGGETIAAETDIIEKIFEAAQQRAQKGSGEPKPGMSMGAMLDMMQRMMGQEPQPGQGQKPGQGAGEQGGEGQTGESDTPNGASGTGGDGIKTERRFEKAGGTAGSGLPPEFQKALDAYNKSR